MSSLALLRRAAADPNQPEWRLRLYAEEEAIAASVAGNPAISLELMLRLGKEHPRALAQNPALVLHASIDAGFLTVLDAGARFGREFLPGVLEDLVPLPECPVPVLEFAIGHPRPGLYRALLNNPTLSAAQLLRIEKQVRERRLSRVRISDVRQHTNHPQPLAGDPKEVLVNELSRMPFSPWATRTAMAHGRVGARLEHLLVAANPIEALPHCHTPQVALRGAQAQNPEVRIAAAKAPGLPPEGIELLAGDSDQRVRRQLSERGDLPMHVARALVGDDKSVVSSELAANERLPTDLLDILVEDPRTWSNIDRNPAALERHLTHIADGLLAAGGVTSNILTHVCTHPATSVSVLLRIHQADASESVRRNLAVNPHLPTDLLREFAASEDEYLRAAVARNPAAPAALLEDLRVDPSHMVRRAVLGRRHLPAGWLDSFLDDPHKSVRLTAEQRLEDRKRRRARGNPVEEIDLDNLGASQDRPLLACFRGMPAAAYRDLAEDPSPITRMAVALNPDAPAEVRQALAHDPSLLVRAAASGAGARGEAA